ncbi:101aa long hypothetical protein [Pyrococcus horikoshii OT3]|uniref:Uncharacterized protein n=1 Tax=Pyrococcus horikoshii (strain ATCC 700860 / DSM 12428 / JCM 9974 / NBRC 100139 / OT-3) TaxID=70601 RepID=O59315_PYRHO|nr:101aa long hypothetical protein [Pyrococcus horikoshii OT3]
MVRMKRYLCYKFRSPFDFHRNWICNKEISIGNWINKFSVYRCQILPTDRRVTFLQSNFYDQFFYGFRKNSPPPQSSYRSKPRIIPTEILTFFYSFPCLGFA